MADTLLNLYQAMQSRPVTHGVGICNGETVQVEEFLRRVNRWRLFLQGISGNNFALFLCDSIEFGAALLGAWQARKTIWLTADTLVSSTASLSHLVDGFLGEFSPELMPLQPPTTHADNDGSSEAQPPLPADFIGLVVHTSGTTGAAQAIPKRLSQLSSEVSALESLFGPQLGHAEIIATVSHQHIYGLLFKVLWPLVAGRAIHAHSVIFPEQLVEVLARRSCVLIASPAHLKRLPDHLDWQNARDCLAAVFSSGGPLEIDVAHTTGTLLGKIPLEVYGSSETGGIGWRQRSPDAAQSWQALPQVAWRIAEDGNLLEVRSSHLADNDWFRTADQAQAQADGGFLLQGRSDRIVKIEEKRISLDAMEAALTSSPLASAARILVCDEEPGQRQRLAAFVVLSNEGKRVLIHDGKTILNRRLRDLLVGTIELVALPRRWRYLEQMPLDAQGKISRVRLLALLDSKPRRPILREIERSDTHATFEIGLPSDLLYFDGHFPQAPILPGVVQVDWAIEIGRRYFPLPPHFLGMNTLKFQHVIQPHNVITLELLHDAVKHTLNFRYASAHGQHASGRILFGDQNAASS